MAARQRTNFRPDVRKAARDRAAGKCEGVMPTGLRCEAVLVAGFYIFDHVLPDYLGGRADLDNCQVLCKDCDRAKTAADQSTIADTRRAFDAHHRLRSPRKPMAGGRYDRVRKGFDGITRDRVTGVVKSRPGSIDVRDL
ncbi:HNH endonuclease [Methylobacterium sp. E-065]|uniref:HNH endonuclease n=1 Tax=Methylobacterium sp. E-065 TaxID=2836583 RepID=UPI001FB93732|nr:HNH endonuclease signature motif containing protein [Methylobacterium sp. E-065]MCJ2020572.1 HNH endonuclease [Methylobacterium sp. E-065]